jgi:hypothetical protein
MSAEGVEESLPKLLAPVRRFERRRFGSLYLRGSWVNGEHRLIDPRGHRVPDSEVSTKYCLSNFGKRTSCCIWPSSARVWSITTSTRRNSCGGLHQLRSAI